MDFDSEIYRLSSKFFHDYPISKFSEIMCKEERPYNCLLIDTHDFLICIPFRSDIHHNNAFLFSGTIRSKYTRSGLDYSKIVIIKNLDYIDSSTPAIVDQDEYREVMQNLLRIVSEASDYVDTYINCIRGNISIHPKQFERKYRYSSLKYFHDVMGL